MTPPLPLAIAAFVAGLVLVGLVIVLGATEPPDVRAKQECSRDSWRPGYPDELVAACYRDADRLGER